MAKNYKEFDVKRPGFTDSVKIRIYKTPESMRKGYLEEWNKFHPHKKNSEDLYDSVGLFYPTGYLVADHIGGRFTSNIYGIMFFNEKFTTQEIIVHECAHAAFSHEKNIERFGMDYSEDDAMIHEERFAYYLGWLSYMALDILKKQGYLR
ncbi:MAG: hypothetical protein LBK63_08450 [Treponema sp.]|nr:hypothetical protein [Treponema sp.]